MGKTGHATILGILNSVNNTPKTQNKLNYSFLYTTITTKTQDWKADVTGNSKIYVTGDINAHSWKHDKSVTFLRS